MLDRKFHSWTHDKLQRACAQALDAKGFCRKSGRLLARELLKYSADRLFPFRSYIEDAKNVGWVVDIGRQHRKIFSPMRYLLLEFICKGDRMALSNRRTSKRRSLLRDDASFIDKLKKAAKTESSVRAVAGRLQVDAKTVKAHANRLQIEGPWKLETRALRNGNEKSAILEETRKEWKRFIELGFTCSQIRKSNPALYWRLYRNDRNWMKAHFPRRHQASPKSRVDWPALDDVLSVEILRRSQEIRCLSPPVRVTLAELERRLGKVNWLRPRLGKLPRSDSAVKAVLETTEDFQIRRVWHVKRILRKNDTPLKAWRIRRMAGLNPNISERVLSCISSEA
ncbi:TnsD family Tn7-like transposition protein [Poseidonocella sp. HB161398]|uniref:TnsD family Tn7-like transposition protein n=1 Tax=Poseidonocella sp. HB161398 TaxID=2320855 RepID=UPI001F0EC0CA|nr:TnsD family Tn7-like transposition protein [Poseidonocella sp. HB161398]